VLQPNLNWLSQSSGLHTWLASQNWRRAQGPVPPQSALKPGRPGSGAQGINGCMGGSAGMGGKAGMGNIHCRKPGKLGQKPPQLLPPTNGVCAACCCCCCCCCCWAASLLLLPLLPAVLVAAVEPDTEAARSAPSAGCAAPPP
jgi:hypothetical protein